jgi:hypothetical protein
MAKTSKRLFIEPAPKMARAINKARTSGNRIEVDGILIYPPQGFSKTWRLRTSYKNVLRERKSSDDNGDINAAFLELISLVESLQLGAAGFPEYSNSPLADVIENYIQQGGPENKWKGKTPQNRAEDFNHLIRIAREENIKCSEFNASVERRYLKAATNSGKRAKGLVGVIKTFVRWGRQAGYFSNEQVEDVCNVTWTPPKGSTYKVAPTRREQSQINYGTDTSRGGQIPTHDQVVQLGKAMQNFYEHGEAIAHVAANLGTRVNETIIFTASALAHKQGKGNFVDLQDEVVKVHWQNDGIKGVGKRVTKNNKFRSVVIPPLENIVSGFDIYEWLRVRSAEALQEQAQGKNPLALIFPNSKGNVWNPNYFNSNVMRPALDSLNWKMPGNADAAGVIRYMYRFTFHSFRDRYGTTAADEWGYSERQLLEQGSWADPETVRSFYLGTDDKTYESVKNLHHSNARFKKGRKAN